MTSRAYSSWSRRRSKSSKSAENNYFSVLIVSCGYKKIVFQIMVLDVIIWFTEVLGKKYSLKSMWNTAVGIKNCKELFSLRLAFTTQKKATHTAEMMPEQCVAIFWIVNASSGEKSCLQFSIPTEPGVGGEGGVSHCLNPAGAEDCQNRQKPLETTISQF